VLRAAEDRTGKVCVHTGNSPRSNYLNVGLETVESELKPDLIVSFPRAAMGYEAGK
jgi:hypothetical protein